MIINNKSRIEDILQAVAGTWQVSEDNGWRCIESGKIRFFRKNCETGPNTLPQKFLNERYETTPVIEFRKDTISGQVLNLQQTALNVTEPCIAVIIQF
jgi:hypothetical protein